MKILSVANTKIVKGEKLGYKTFGIHLAPHKLSGKNVCASASKGCIKACLNEAGFGIYKSVKDARLKKTNFFFHARKKFLEQLVKEIKSSIKSAEKNDLVPCFRLNLTSDIAWETIKVQDDKNIMELFPQVQFYDYTKHLPRMMKSLTDKSFPKNYHLTFSRSESNETACKIVLGCGGNVAVVFRNRLPKTWNKKRVIDATTHDVRFLDPKKTIAGLIELGPAKKDASGFVVTRHLSKLEKKANAKKR